MLGWFEMLMYSRPFRFFFLACGLYHQRAASPPPENGPLYLYLSLSLSLPPCVSVIGFLSFES